MAKAKSNTLRITPRQEIFAQHFALTGNGARSALRSGCSNYSSARVRASKWLANLNIRARIREIRQEAFSELRLEVSTALLTCVLRSLEEFGYGHQKECRKALALLKRLGVWEHDKALSREIQEIEAVFGRPIEEVFEALDELYETDWDAVSNVLASKNSHGNEGDSTS
ncbi:MAG: terminase small subunit [Acidobacteria bacterium]|nr:terminase small subunit [Acidobacteriota bacterium]